MRKPFVPFLFLSLMALAPLLSSAPVARKPSLLIQLNPNYLRAMAAYKRLEPRLTHEELRAITTIGILNGAREVEERMEANLIVVIKDLLENTNVEDQKSVLPKIARIEEQVARDQHALEILTSAMDLATGKMSAKEFRREMKEMQKEIRGKGSDQLKLPAIFEGLSNETVYGEIVSRRVGNLRRNILNEMDTMKEMVDKKIGNVLEVIVDRADQNGLIAQASERMLHKRKVNGGRVVEKEEPVEIRIINSILTEADFRNNLIENSLEKRKDSGEDFEDVFELTKKVIANRSDSRASITGRVVNNNNKSIDAINAANKTSENGKTAKQQQEEKQKEKEASSAQSENPAKQEAGSPEFPDDGPEENGGGGGGGGGGIVGIITSLSGGEGGSDVGALIGALTGVISTLFGPGGLDVDSLIGTGTSLISGLLAGDKNFGTVLGMYVGTAFDGLSGGGGAVNNGKFIGNFLGTVIASLSADPEEDDAPIQPLIFVENFLSSFAEAKNRKGSDEEMQDDRKDHPSMHGMKDGGSDSGGFVKSIVSHLVSTAISLVLNASLGAVGGASKASTSLFASSAHKSAH